METKYEIGQKVNKNYFSINVIPHCSVFLDEYLMKKANKILFKYQKEMETLLENNIDHLIEQNWSLAYPKGKQETFYGTDLKGFESPYTSKFYTQKVESLFFIGNESIYSEKVIKSVEVEMEKLLD